MSEWVVFGTGTPGAPNETDGPIALSTGFKINDGGTYWCTGIEFYAASSAPTGVVVTLYVRNTDESSGNTPGATLATKAAGGAITPGARNRILFDTPVQVTAAAYPNGLYATLTSANRYVATGGYFTAADVVSGPITAYQNNGGVGFNGRFRVTPTPTDATNSYPNQTFGGGGYWVSPVITDVNPSGDPIDAVLAATSPRGVMSLAAVEQIATSLNAFSPVGIMDAQASQVEPVSADFTATSPRSVMSLAASSSIVPASGSFEPLLDMVRNARRQVGARVRVTSCPRCGSPLEAARGVLHCPMGDWTG